MIFPLLGNEENEKKQLSQYWETKKMRKNDFPNIGTQKD